MHHRLPAILAVAALLVLPSRARAAPEAVPVGLTLSASPSVVDVGSPVVFTLRARNWNGPVSVTLSFLSPHHGFTGPMTWRPACACFQLAVVLARRIHALETARAVVRVRADGIVSSASTTFQIRGLANNGRDFAPGGQVLLTAWVSDPHPSKNQYQHYCALTRTVDGLGVPGYRVRFVVRFPTGNRTYAAGPTGRNGVACTSKSIGALRSGTIVRVRVYAGNLQTSLRFKSQT